MSTHEAEPIEPVVLEAGRLWFRPWREDDVDDAWAALQDPAVRMWNGGSAGSREDTADLLRRRGDWSAGDHASWAVVDGADGVLLGSVSLHSIDRVQGNAQVGYWTAAAARGRGVAPTAVDAVCRWAFGALPVDRIELCHAVQNEASGRVAVKAGFTYEGRPRRSFRYGDGAKHDELLWSRLDDDPPPPAGTR